MKKNLAFYSRASEHLNKQDLINLATGRTSEKRREPGVEIRSFIAWSGILTQLASIKQKR